MGDVIYLDNAATTKVEETVVEQMNEYNLERFYNPGTKYPGGLEAAAGIKEARENVARLINADPCQCIFTSGATEANASAIYDGVMKSRILLCSPGEHDSIFRNPFVYNVIKISKNGSVDIDAFDDLCSQIKGRESGSLYRSTYGIAISYINNEIGCANPIYDIIEIAKRNGIKVHLDCTQAIPIREINVADLECDSISFSSHKIHGPKGAGCLYVKDPDSFIPLIYGGEFQEFGKRGGTQNVPAIVGFGSACKILKERQCLFENVLDNRVNFYNSLCEQLEKDDVTPLIVHTNGISDSGILNLLVEGVDAESLVITAASLGVIISAGSACHGAVHNPSRILKAIGLTDEEAMSSIRVSIGLDTHDLEIARATRIISTCIKYLLNNK